MVVYEIIGVESGIVKMAIASLLHFGSTLSIFFIISVRVEMREQKKKKIQAEPLLWNSRKGYGKQVKNRMKRKIKETVIRLGWLVQQCNSQENVGVECPNLVVDN